MSRYTITLDEELTARSTVMLTFRARITFDWLDDLYSLYGEARLLEVEQVNGGDLERAKLQEWAEDFLTEFDELHKLLDKDRSTLAEQAAALQAMYARQGVALGVAA